MIIPMVNKNIMSTINSIINISLYLHILSPSLPPGTTPFLFTIFYTRYDLSISIYLVIGNVIII